MKDGGMYLLSAEGGAKLEMWHDPPPPGTESISLPGGTAKGAGLGDGVGGGGGAGRWLAEAAKAKGVGGRQGFYAREGKIQCGLNTETNVPVFPHDNVRWHCEKKKYKSVLMHPGWK